MENSVLPDLVLLRFTPVASSASYSFYCPPRRSIANSSSAMQWYSIGRRKRLYLTGRHRLNWALESLFTFALLVFRTKQGVWHKRIQLMKGSHFPSTRTTNLVRLILGSQKGNNFTRTALWKVHPTSPFALRAETSSRSNMIPLRTKFNTQTTVISHERRRKRFSSSVGHLFQGEFSDWRQNTGFGDKSIVFLHFPRKFRAGQLYGLLSVKFHFRNVIFQPMVFPFVWAKYKWKFMRDRCKLSFPRHLASSPLARAFSRGLLRSPK